MPKPRTRTDKKIKDFDNSSLRKVKSDKADAAKITRYALKYTKLHSSLSNFPKTYQSNYMLLKNNLLSYQPN